MSTFVAKQSLPYVLAATTAKKKKSININQQPAWVSLQRVEKGGEKKGATHCSAGPSIFKVISCSGLLPVAKIIQCGQKQLGGRKHLLWLTLLGHNPSLGKVKAGAMEECSGLPLSSLNYSQLPFLYSV